VYSGGGFAVTLTGAQYQQFMEALLDAYTEQRLTEMVRFRLEKRLPTIASGSDFREIVFKLIDVAEAEGWTERLIVAARESIPGNPKLLTFAEQFGLAPPTPPQREIERSIEAAEGDLDIVQWRQRLGEIETQVCRVDVKGSGYATAFLVGPDAVITCRYVMAELIEGRLEPQDFIFRFDYKVMPDGTAINPGTEYRLATDWLIDQSSFQQPDADSAVLPTLPRPDELDYALLRIDGTPGHDQVGNRPEPDAPPRKWITPPREPHEFVPGADLFIVHHPRAAPLKVSFSDQAVIGPNGNGTRVLYDVHTEEGSGGSPCFNASWELVAMHEGAIHNPEPPLTGPVGLGVPFNAIVNRLHERGFGAALGG
jgi:hypothetical protein